MQERAGGRAGGSSSLTLGALGERKLGAGYDFNSDKRHRNGRRIVLPATCLRVDACPSRDRRPNPDAWTYVVEQEAERQSIR